MSADQDLPRPGSGNVYDAQFADRIAGISKGGGPPAPSPTPTPGNSGRKAGVGGVVIVLFILLKIAVFGGRGCSRNDRDPTYTYSPPVVDFDKGDPAFEPRREVRPDLFLPPPDGERYLLVQEDLIFAPSLCREIVEGKAKPGPNPSRRVYQELDAADRTLVDRLAATEKAKPEEEQAVRAALNRLLERPRFFDPVSFRDLPCPKEGAAFQLLWRGLLAPAIPEQAHELNRRALDAAYPEQLFPVDCPSQERTRTRPVRRTRAMIVHAAILRAGQ